MRKVGPEFDVMDNEKGLDGSRHRSDRDPSGRRRRPRAEEKGAGSALPRQRGVRTRPERIEGDAQKRGRKMKLKLQPDLRFDCRGSFDRGRRPLSGEAVAGERFACRRFLDICCRRGSFFLDLGEQPGRHRSSDALSLRVIVREIARLEDDGAQLGGAAATIVVEVYERKPGPRHRILQESDHWCGRQAVLAAQMQESADKAVATVSIVITTPRPMAVIGKKLKHKVEQLHRFGDFRFSHWVGSSRSGIKYSAYHQPPRSRDALAYKTTGAGLLKRNRRRRRAGRGMQASAAPI
jgi:hypothetical protein